MTLKTLRKDLIKSLSRIKKIVKDVFYTNYEKEIERQKLLNTKHKKIKTIEKYIKILNSVKKDTSFKTALKEYKKEQQKIKEINNIELEEVQQIDNINNIELEEIQQENNKENKKNIKLKIKKIEPKINNIELEEVQQHDNINNIELEEVKQQDNINNIELEEVQYEKKKKQYIKSKYLHYIEGKINKIEENILNNANIKKDQERIIKEHNEFIERLKAYVKNVEKSSIEQTITTIIDKPYKISIESFIYEILEHLKPHEYSYNIECNGTWRTLNDRTCDAFYQLLMEDLSIYSKTGDYGSDAEYIREFLECDSITIERNGKKNKKKTKEGGFFKYYNLTNIDLSKYQIFKLNDPLENYKDNCLVYALKQGGLSDIKYNLLKTFVKNREIPRTDFSMICEKLDISIRINGEERNSNKYNTGTSNEIYYIGEIDNHYFINEKTLYTSYSILNYHDIKDKKDFNYIYKYRIDDNSYRRDKERVISSFELIKLLHDNKDKYLTDITVNNSKILTTQFYNQIKLIPDDLNYPDICVRLPKNDYIENISLEEEEEEEEEKTDDNNEELKDKVIDKTSLYDVKIKKRILTNYYFDFETYPEDTIIKVNGKNKTIQAHKPYLCRWVKEDFTKKSFRGFNCAWNFLASLKNNTRLIAHNSNFDFRFIISYLSRVKEVMKDNHFIKLTGYFKNNYIEIIDSYNFLPEKLCKFTEMFKLGSTIKEVMPYDIYNRENIRKIYVEIEEALKSVHLKKESKKKQFLENIEKWNLQKGTTYNIVEYSNKYCELDCEILMRGFTTFQKWIKEQLDIDIFEVATISSLAFKYLLKNDVFKDVYEMCGVPQLFIAKCQVGGKCMSKNNEKHIFDSEIENDVMLLIDMTSLYPSAMVRLHGLLKGKPKVIIIKTKEFLDKCDGYFVEIKITKVGIKRPMPLLSFIDENNGVRDFTNDMVGKNIYIDKTALEDAIKYQDIEYEIIKGYYFDEGFNDKIVKVIKDLFEIRKKYKGEENPIELVYKLILNSAYGRTILRASEYKTVVINNYKGDAEIYLSKNHNIIHSHNRNVQGGKNWRFKVYKSIDMHYNLCQVGSSILSMSKRLMNEVICTGEDGNLDISYTDTDSLHIKKKDYLKLKDLYKTEHKRELEGKDLGQMHNDFQIFDEYGDKIKCKEVYAIKSIILGKKSYLDKLVGITENDEIINSYHTRLKAITPVSLEYTTNRLHNDLEFKRKCKIEEDINDYEDVYKALHKGHEIPFDLLAGGDGCHFKMHRDYTVEELDDFTRKLKF